MKMCLWVFGRGIMNFELQPFKRSHFWQLFCTVRYQVCVINSSYRFQNVSQILKTYCEHIEYVPMGFGLSYN